jgi:hypothetical protein
MYMDRSLICSCWLIVASLSCVHAHGGDCDGVSAVCIIHPTNGTTLSKGSAKVALGFDDAAYSQGSAGPATFCVELRNGNLDPIGGCGALQHGRR